MNGTNKLPNQLIDLLKSVSPEQISENALEGHLYKYHPEIILPQYKEIYQKEFIARWNKNLLHEKALLELKNDLLESKISPILLKGMSFLDELYPDKGSRFMSDIDLLIDYNNADELCKILESNNYTQVIESKWKANQHKITFEKFIENSQVVIEIHTKLFYTSNFKIEKTLPSIYLPFQTLEKELCLLHLIGHCAFAHTFLKFFWLIDIYKFITHYIDLIDWKYFYFLAKQYKLQKSCAMINFIMNKYFGIDCLDKMAPTWFQNYLYSILFIFPFLINGHKHKFRYFVIKHLTKDSLLNALEYDLFWFLNWIRQKKR